MNWLRAQLKWSIVGTAFFSLMTLLAVAPYDLGKVALTFPPWAKPWIFGLGVPLTCLSRLFAARKKAEQIAPSPPPPVVQNFYTFNISAPKKPLK